MGFNCFKEAKKGTELLSTYRMLLSPNTVVDTRKIVMTSKKYAVGTLQRLYYMFQTITQWVEPSIGKKRYRKAAILGCKVTVV